MYSKRTTKRVLANHVMPYLSGPTPVQGEMIAVAKVLNVFGVAATIMHIITRQDPDSMRRFVMTETALCRSRHASPYIAEFSTVPSRSSIVRIGICAPYPVHCYDQCGYRITTSETSSPDLFKA